jgi:signal transduction histidine kinase
MALAVRIFLLLVGAVLLAVGLTTALAQWERAQVVDQFRERAAAARLATIVQILSPLSPEARAAAVRALPEREWRIALGAPAGDPEGLGPAPLLAELLGEAVAGAATVDAGWQGRPPSCGEASRCPRQAGARLSFPDGQGAVLLYSDLRPGKPFPGGNPLPLNVALFLVILAAAAWWAVRLALRPLRRLEAAVEGFGRDIDHPPLDESGPREVRGAARAFNAMRERIRAHVAERTRILAAVAHDLKTPLTRLRLKVEGLPDEALKEKLLEDLGAMKHLVAEGLDLAQSLETREPIQRVALASLLQSLCDDAAEAGQDVRYEGAPDLEILVSGRPRALRRVFSNLIDNAVKYGGRARLDLIRRENRAVATVRDEGPGIPEAHLRDVLQPFFRLESSRSRETGGTGLGLAIAANLLAAQGGSLELANRPEGGLAARVVLPLSR